MRKFKLVLAIAVIFVLGCQKGTQKLCVKCSTAINTKISGNPDQLKNVEMNTCGIVVSELDKYLSENNYTRSEIQNGVKTSIISKTTCKGNPE